MSRSLEKSRARTTAASSSAGRATVADGRQRLVASGTGEFLLHLSQSRSNDVVVMNVRTDGLDGVEPEPMNEVEVARRERRAGGRRSDRCPRDRCRDESRGGTWRPPGCRGAFPRVAE